MIQTRNVFSLSQNKPRVSATAVVQKLAAIYDPCDVQVEKKQTSALCKQYVYILVPRYTFCEMLHALNVNAKCDVTVRSNTLDELAPSLR